MEMIGCQPVGMWWWQGCRGRKIWRECVKDDMDKQGLHSEWVICGEASYREKRLTLAEFGRNGRF